MTNDDALGGWVAGFTDGEGCFSLHAGQRSDGAGFNVTCAFQIKVRADDRAALGLVREALGVGTIRESRVYRGSREQVTFGVTRLDELVAVVAFFDRHRLRAKKRRDFAVWREAVLLLWAIQSRPRARTGTPRGTTRWADEDRSRVAELAGRLKAGRLWGVL